MERRTIFFDMDGTIADLYNVKDWLSKLRRYDPTPYKDATPLLNMQRLSRALNRVQRAGWRLAIVSWLSKEPQAEYDEAVKLAKASWLKKHLRAVRWDEIHIVAHGTPKYSFARTTEDILFDDEKKNRDAWTGKAYAPEQIFDILSRC